MTKTKNYVSASAMTCQLFPRWFLSAILPPLGCKRTAVSASATTDELTNHSSLRQYLQ